MPLKLSKRGLLACSHEHQCCGAYMRSEEGIYLPILVLSYCDELTLGNPINLTPCIVQLYKLCQGIGPGLSEYDRAWRKDSFRRCESTECRS